MDTLIEEEQMRMGRLNASASRSYARRYATSAASISDLRANIKRDHQGITPPPHALGQPFQCRGCSMSLDARLGRGRIKPYS